ncbi:MAG: helix-turn-helix transcriptional regulator [Acidobacteria bacterium]|nr:helix-turn-helix transcriptional regulator [Acidobacteriota bacterium]
MDRFSPDAFLPLSPVVFEILLALAGEDRHGYAIMQEVEARSGGGISLHAGSLYRALARLLEQELIEELDGRAAETDDERRRSYRLTARGRAVARAEAARLAVQVERARASRLLGSRT